MPNRQRCAPAIAVLFAFLSGSEVMGQGPTINSGGVGVPELLRNESSLGVMPGSGGTMSGNAPGSDRPVIGGAPGATTPNVPPSLSTPGGQGYQLLGAMGIGLTPQLPPASLPLFGVLALPGEEDLGPPDGLTLDDALQRLVSANLDLRGRFLEIPQARADILTASLYANPLLFFDTQLIPYGSYSLQRPGGQTQWDLNISHPVDLSGKRRARIGVATAAKSVIEAQYQDSVRVEIANLYEAYLGALLAREAVRFSKAALTGLDQILEIIQEQKKQKIATQADVDSVLIQRELAAASVLDSEKTYESTKVRLGALLNIPPAEAERLELRGSFKVEAPPPPLGNELVSLALQSRPDVQAFRLGVALSKASVKLACANRLADVYVLFQPFTFQDNSYMNKDSATSWALGATVPLPVYNRNQGNIQRSQINVQQSMIELKAQEVRVVTEVKQAEKEYLIARSNVERMEQTIRPAADRVLNTARVRWRSGEKDVLFYLSAVRDYNAFVREYLTNWLRFRRSMLRINTVAGQRILP
ncbi:MAG TPA: TolC family protein [Gemmataceae bacterium]|jgi:cobalt-zinc-cadmium efflux system outer membrane protein